MRLSTEIALFKAIHNFVNLFALENFRFVPLCSSNLGCLFLFYYLTTVFPSWYFAKRLNLFRRQIHQPPLALKIPSNPLIWHSSSARFWRYSGPSLFTGSFAVFSVSCLHNAWQFQRFIKYKRYASKMVRRQNLRKTRLSQTESLVYLARMMTTNFRRKWNGIASIASTDWRRHSHSFFVSKLTLSEVRWTREQSTVTHWSEWC